MTVKTHLIFTTCLCLFISCAHISEESSIHVTKVKYASETGQPIETDYQADCRWLEQDRLGCDVSFRRMCTKTEYKISTRQKVTTRKAPAAIQLLAYLGGAAAVGAGIGVVADAPNVVADDDPEYTNPVGREGAYWIGSGLIVAGVALITTGIVDSVRARDSQEPAGLLRTPVLTKEQACAEGSLVSTEIQLTGEGVPSRRAAINEELLLVRDASSNFAVGRKTFSLSTNSVGKTDVGMTDLVAAFCPDADDSRYKIQFADESLVDVTEYIHPLCFNANRLAAEEQKRLDKEKATTEKMGEERAAVNKLREKLGVPPGQEITERDFLMGFLKECDAGHGWSCNIAAYWMLQGKGVKKSKDHTVSVKLFERACALGYKPGCEAREEIRRIRGW